MAFDNQNIGILGLGSKTTLFYIEELNRQYNNLYGGYSTCPFKLLNVNFDKINQLLPNPSEALSKIVSDYLEQLLTLEIDSIVIPNITLHETIDWIFKNKNVPVNLIHPVKSTIEKLKENNVDNVVLIGSLYIVNSEYINSTFKANNISIQNPIKADMHFIDSIRQKVYRGTETTELVNQYNMLLKNYARNANIVIACTELSIINGNSSPNVYDMVRIQVEDSIKNVKAHQF